MTDPGFSFDRTTRRFRSPTGRFLPAATVRGAIDRLADGVSGEVRAVSERLQAGELNATEWERQVRAILKASHIAAGTIAVGGKAQLDASKIGYMGSLLRDQYAYLRSFGREIEAGLPLDGRFLARSAMYGQAVRGTYEGVNRKLDIAAGYTRERRVLHGANPCEGCIAEAAKGWRPAGELLPIGGCQCLSGCKCSFLRKKGGVVAMSDTDNVTFGKGGGSKGGSGGKSGKGKGAPDGAVWKTIGHHPVLVKDGVVVGGGFPGITHDHKTGVPLGRVKPHHASIPMHPGKPGKAKPAAKSTATHDPSHNPRNDDGPSDRRAMARDQRKAAKAVEKAGKDVTRAKGALDAHSAGVKAGRAELDKIEAAHKAKHAAKIDALKAKLAKAKGSDKSKGHADAAGKALADAEHARQAAKAAKASREIKDADKAQKAEDAAHTARLEAAKPASKPAAKTKHTPGKAGMVGKPNAVNQARAAHGGKGEVHTAESYAAKHGIGGANAFAHLDKLHAAGKVAHHEGTYFVPHGTAGPKASPAKPVSPMGENRTIAPRPRSGDIIRSSAPRDAREAAVHADAKARGKSSMVVTATPTYHATAVGDKISHHVGDKHVASHHVNADGHHVVTTHHRNGTHTTTVHTSKDAARKHLAAYVAHRTAKGTTRHVVVGHDLSKFDHTRHGIGGAHHRVTGRVLGDGGHVKFDDGPDDDGPPEIEMGDGVVMFGKGGAKAGKSGKGSGGCGDGAGGFKAGNSCGHAAKAARIRKNAPGHDASGIDHATVRDHVEAQGGKYTHGAAKSPADRKHLAEAEARGGAAVKITPHPKVRAVPTRARPGAPVGSGLSYHVGDTPHVAVVKHGKFSDSGNHEVHHGGEVTEHRTVKGAIKAARKLATGKARDDARALTGRVSVKAGSAEKTAEAVAGETGVARRNYGSNYDVHVRTLHRGRGSEATFTGVEGDDMGDVTGDLALFKGGGKAGKSSGSAPTGLRWITIRGHAVQVDGSHNVVSGGFPGLTHDAHGKADLSAHTAPGRSKAAAHKTAKSHAAELAKAGKAGTPEGHVAVARVHETRPPARKPATPGRMAARVGASGAEASAHKVAHATGQLRALAAGTHGGDAHAHIDRVARGSTKAELFDAAKGAGIAHGATTKKALVDHLKAAHGGKAPEAPKAAKPAVPPKVAEAIKAKPPARATAPAKPPAKPAESRPPMTHDTAIAHLRDLQSRSHTLHPNDIAHEVDRVASLPAKELAAVEKSFLGGNIGTTKAGKLDAIQKKIDDHRTAHERVEGIRHAGAGTKYAPADAESKYPKHPGRGPKAGGAPKAVPKAVAVHVARAAKAAEPAKPVALSPAGHAAHEGLKSLQSAAHTMEPQEIREKVAGLTKLPAKELDAVQHHFLGAKVGSTRADAIRAINKKIDDHRTMHERVAGIRTLKA